ncbi:hypothetical protein, partial [Vibrio parahaemolyticus]|uniref:hypothetical protein n=3 Tax=Vibrio parahaemolyticus TaxID=670 RepID=UPI001C5FA9FA
MVTFASCPYDADPISCGLSNYLLISHTAQLSAQQDAAKKVRGVIFFEFRHFTTFKKAIKSES